MKILASASALSVLAFTLATSGCMPDGAVATDGYSAPTTPTDPLAADEAAFGDLRARLQASRAEALGKSAMELEAIGNTLYYRTYPGFSPVFHRLAEDGTKIDYAFSIGAGDDANVHASESLVVTAERKGDVIVYRGYDARASKTVKTSAELPTPSGEQKWWAYSVSGETIYVVTTPSERTGAGHMIWTIAPGGTAKELFTLESTKMSVGELLDFSVDGDTMMVIESGRLWKVDLATKTSNWMKNKTEIAGAVNFARDGVAWEDAKGLKFYDYSENTLRDLSGEIAASDFTINKTYARSHHFYSATTSNNFTRYRDAIVYTGSAGIFAYDLKTKKVAPVLLDVSEENLRVSYRYPVVLDNGTAFIVGLTSESGSVGADGPVYRTDLGRLLSR